MHSRVQQRVLQAVHEADPPFETVQIPGAEADIRRHSVHTVLLCHRDSALKFFAYVTELGDVV